MIKQELNHVTDRKNELINDEKLLNRELQFCRKELSNLENSLNDRYYFSKNFISKVNWGTFDYAHDGTNDNPFHGIFYDTWNLYTSNKLDDEKFHRDFENALLKLLNRVSKISKNSVLQLIYLEYKSVYDLIIKTRIDKCNDLVHQLAKTRANFQFYSRIFKEYHQQLYSNSSNFVC